MSPRFARQHPVARFLPMRYLALWLALAALISAFGFGAFYVARKEVIAYQWGFLEEIADDRVHSVVAWIADRTQEAIRVTGNERYIEAFQSAVTPGRSLPPSWDYLRTDIGALLARPHYEAIGLYDSRGRLVRVFGQSAALQGPAESKPFRNIHFADAFVRLDTRRAIRFVMVAPVWDGDRFLGTIRFVIDPAREASQFLRPWQSSQTPAEVYLFRPEGDAILFLTPLAFGEAPLLVPQQRELLARQGLIREGRTTGVDYMGEPSIGVARAIPGTPWRLMAKVHEAEAFALVRGLAALAFLISLALIGMAGGFAYSRLRRREEQFRADRLKSELDRRALVHHFDYLSKFANDVIILTDGKGRIIEVNDRASEVYGYTRDELLNRWIGELRTEETRPQLVADWDAILQQGAAIVEAEHQRKDGSRFPIEASWRRIRVENRDYIQTIIRDITERKRAEAAITRLTRLYRALNETNETILRQKNEHDLLTKSLEVATREAGFVAAWIMRPDRGRRYLEITAFQGVDEDDFRALMSPSITEIERGLVTSARAIRDSHYVYVNDYQSQPAAEPIHEWLLQHGVGAAASFPLFIEGRSEAVLGVYSYETRPFDSEVLALLQKMADNLAFAIHSVRQSIALAESQERLALVFEATDDCYWDVRLDLGRVYVSPAFVKAFGLPREDFSIEDARKLVSLIVHPDDLTRVVDEFSSHFSGATPELVSEFRAYTVAKQEVWVRARGRIVLRDAQGAPLRMTGVHTNITQERATREQLRLWANVFSNSREMIVIADHRGHVVAANRAFQEVAGYTADEAIGLGLGQIAGYERTETVRRVAWGTVKATGYWQGEIQARKKSGEAFPVWVTITAVPSAGGETELLICIASDLSERRAAEERINFLAYYDGLTGLPNRRLFSERLEQALADARANAMSVAVMVLDIDEFKNINDSLSPQVGDQLLRAVSARLVASLGARGLVAHSGGDEFLVMATNLSEPSAAADVAAIALRTVAEPFTLGEAEVRITATIGIAVSPNDGDQADVLIKNANSAIHYAKNTGRNHFQFYFDELNRRARNRWLVENALRRAAENGEFMLLYQPQVDSAHMKPTGMEALIRWPHQGRLLTPSEFVPIAEETGTILPIGDWVLHEACRQKLAWQDLPGMREAVMAVNLSAVQYREKNVLERIARFLRESCLPGAFELELTESMIMREAEESLGALRGLKESGIRIAIDDFGTGYSSLSYLRRFPIDRLKVDQSFVRELPVNAATGSIVTAIVMLAKSLNLDVLAEGVETTEQAEQLRERGCDHLQGFYFSQPLTAEEMARWWRAQVAPDS